MTPEEIGAAIRAFRSDNCPACNAEKQRKRDPFCSDCVRSLPFDLQEDVLDDGLFLDAFHPALAYLNANRKPAAPPASEDEE